MVIGTKFDEICPVLKGDPELVYTSSKAEQSVKKVSSETGVPVPLVFPVINYTADKITSKRKDILALHALDKIVTLAEYYVKEQTGTMNTVT